MFNHEPADTAPISGLLMSWRMIAFAGEVIMERLERISIDPGICHGKPTIRGLRYTVEMLLELLSSGMTHEEILADYEDLEEADILAALAYAVN